jgi:endonuclease YncB( thermonuclease family)
MLIRRRFSVILFLAITTSLVLSIPSHAVIRTVEGKVTKVADGDTLTIVTPEGTKLKVRLYGIDTPEIRHNVRQGQPYGEEAKQALTALTLGKKVKVEIVDIDRYRRMVGIVYESGVNINREMVKDGYAWAYRKYLSSPYASEYIRDEEEARNKRLGLWKQANPIPPWEYRRESR